MEFRFWLQERLSHVGWSGAELARRLDISPAAVNKWVNGKTKPSRSQIAKLAAALDVSGVDIAEAIEGRHIPGTITEMVARELPPTMTPDDARLVGHLLGAVVRALQDWNQEEEERESARRARMSGSDGEVPRVVVHYDRRPLPSEEPV